MPRVDVPQGIVRRDARDPLGAREAPCPATRFASRTPTGSLRPFAERRIDWLRSGLYGPLTAGKARREVRELLREAVARGVSVRNVFNAPEAPQSCTIARSPMAALIAAVLAEPGVA